MQLGKRSDRNIVWKGRGKIIPAGDDIIYRNPKEFTLKKPLGLISKFSKIAGYEKYMKSNCISSYLEMNS